MIRVGLIGFGLGGRVFHAPLVSSVEGMELAAVLERTTNKAAARYPGLTTHRSLDEMLADSSLDLFIVSTPNGTHFNLAWQILQAGRNVVVDKPAAATSAEIAQLMRLAASKNVLFIPFHNRRWDSDFRTLKKVLHEELLGRLVSYESRMDRWRPVMPADRVWKDDPASAGGLLLDLGTHLADQALVLLGKPEAVSADLHRERDGAKTNDSFSVRLRYFGFTATLGANCLSLPAGPRFHLRGTHGNYWKSGVDPQEAALGQIARIEDPAWGREPAANYGMLHLGIDGGTVTRPVEALAGDYRLYYAGVRDALLGKTAAPVAAIDAWRVARLLEWAVESSEQREEIVCDWSAEPQ
ncbi:MAG TPA: Gfo/Idh/MocA family oxidoreductase [Terracidiphilus sp.]|jgi:predicted dehydrogenase|nr:Gfo/Idh/MocA family oxidoreductase [Terracidiphilus sp.]